MFMLSWVFCVCLFMENDSPMAASSMILLRQLDLIYACPTFLHALPFSTNWLCQDTIRTKQFVCSQYATIPNYFGLWPQRSATALVRFRLSFHCFWCWPILNGDCFTDGVYLNKVSRNLDVNSACRNIIWAQPFSSARIFCNRSRMEQYACVWYAIFSYYVKLWPQCSRMALVRLCWFCHCFRCLRIFQGDGLLVGSKLIIASLLLGVTCACSNIIWAQPLYRARMFCNMLRMKRYAGGQLVTFQYSDWLRRVAFQTASVTMFSCFCLVCSVRVLCEYCFTDGGYMNDASLKLNENFVCQSFVRAQLLSSARMLCNTLPLKLYKCGWFAMFPYYVWLRLAAFLNSIIKVVFFVIDFDAHAYIMETVYLVAVSLILLHWSWTKFMFPTT